MDAIVGAMVLICAGFVAFRLRERFGVRRIYGPDRWTEMHRARRALERTTKVTRRLRIVAALGTASLASLCVAFWLLVPGPLSAWGFAAFVFQFALSAAILALPARPVAVLVLGAGTERGYDLHRTLHDPILPHRTVSLLDSGLWPEMKLTIGPCSAGSDWVQDVSRIPMPKRDWHNRFLIRLLDGQELAMQLAHAAIVVVVDRRDANPIIERLLNRIAEEGLLYKTVTLEPIANEPFIDDTRGYVVVRERCQLIPICRKALLGRETLPTKTHGIREALIDA